MPKRDAWPPAEPIASDFFATLAEDEALVARAREGIRSAWEARSVADDVAGMIPTNDELARAALAAIIRGLRER